jgi:arylsulfatase A-like enzyme
MTKSQNSLFPFLILILLAYSSTVFSNSSKRRNPNIILMMTDDMGYGDTGFNGNQIIKTPHLDRLCKEGIKFTHFFSGAPVCSPTRATCLTGRHHYRYGIWSANDGKLPREEITVPQILKESGYKTGHFGKWHVGSPNENFTGKNSKNISFPEWFSYDEYFLTAHSLPLYNPFGGNGEDAATSDNPYWYYNRDSAMSKSVRVTENISGEDPRIMMDRVIPFVENSHNDSIPFLAVIWFHTPHKDIDTGPAYRQMYSDYGESKQKYYGCITAMDDQIGRLRNKLEELGELENTMFWFCSDNGPEGGTDGETGNLRGRKRSLYSGGVGVPAFIRWPEYTSEPKFSYQTDENGYRYSNFYASTLDYFPTLLSLTEKTMPDDRPIDGIDLMPWLKGELEERDKAIPFRFYSKKDKMYDSPTVSTIANLNGVTYKYLSNFSDCGIHNQLFNLDLDSYEENNILEDNKPIGDSLHNKCKIFLESFQKSFNGADYNYTPIGNWKPLGGWLNFDPCTGVGNSELKNRNTKLDTTYPNPGRNFTNIKYFIDKPGDVSISIYDMAGKLVHILDEGKKTTGNYNIKWNTGSVESGTYIIKLTSGNFIDTLKCMIQ